MHSFVKTACWAALLCLGAACGEQRSEVQQGTDVTASAVVGDRLVFVDREESRGYWLALGGQSPKARVIERSLPKTPIVIEERHDSEELLVLCQRPADVEDGPEATLMVLGAKGILRRYELGTRYSKLTQSKDGRYAFLSSSGESDGDTSYVNRNDISIVDLDSDTNANNPSQRNLSNDSQPLSAMFVLEEMQINGQTRRLAAILFESRLSVLDLTHPGRREWTAKLADGGNTGTVGLQQAVFSPETLRVYLRGSVSQDVYVLQLRPRSPKAANENDFDFSLNQLGASEATTNIALFPSTEGELLLASTVGPGLLVVNAGTSTVTRVPLGRAADMIVPFSIGDRESRSSQHTLLLKQGENVASFVDLANIEERTDRNVQALTLSGTVATATVLSKNRLLVTYSGPGLSVVNLESREVSSIGSSVPLASDATLVDAARDRVWLVPRGESRIGYFDLDGMQPREIRLDAPLARAALIGGSDVKKVAAIHESQLGYLTLFDADAPSAKTARSLHGYMFDGILDRGED